MFYLFISSSVFITTFFIFSNSNWILYGFIIWIGFDFYSKFASISTESSLLFKVSKERLESFSDNYSLTSFGSNLWPGVVKCLPWETFSLILDKD